MADKRTDKDDNVKEDRSWQFIQEKIVRQPLSRRQIIRYIILTVICAVLFLSLIHICKPYVVPGGGSNPLGALGYVSCAQELLQQSFDMGVNFDHIICPSGSTGTHAGVLSGILGNNANIPVTGISVNRKKEIQTDAAVSYTHLDVYKRQIRNCSRRVF